MRNRGYSSILVVDDKWEYLALLLELVDDGSLNLIVAEIVLRKEVAVDVEAVVQNSVDVLALNAKQLAHSIVNCSYFCINVGITTRQLVCLHRVGIMCATVVSSKE